MKPNRTSNRYFTSKGRVFSPNLGRFKKTKETIIFRTNYQFCLFYFESFFLDFVFKHSQSLLSNFELAILHSNIHIYYIIYWNYGYVDIRTFEVLLRTYEVREGRMEGCQGVEEAGGYVGTLPCKRRQQHSSDEGRQISSTSVVTARPCGEAKGHTGYLTFARLKCIIWTK